MRIFRERQGWSQAQLSQAAGIDRGYVSRIESGSVDPGLEMQGRIADALGISHAELIAQALEEEQRRRRQAERKAGA